MGSAAEQKLVKITVNGTEVEVPEGELIVESVKRLGLEIPIFCYHPRMKPVGMCRMCLVEVGFKQADGSVRMMPKPQAGCTLPASENLVVVTDSESIHRDRKGVLEFLLANHPLDCPICDRGGECPLQNNTIFYGPSTSRFIEVKRHLPKAVPLSEYVTLDLERCIQCGRCVRFTEEISGDSQLAFRFRGAEMQPSTFELTDFTSKFSGNVIEICPVGALTSSKYRFRSRPWDLETKSSICTECGNGCNVWVDYRSGKLVRINGRTNEQVNEEWTCDRGKFGQEYIDSPERLDRVLLRKADALHESSWPEAMDAIAARFVESGDSSAMLVGPRATNEDLYLAREIVTKTFGSRNLDHRWTKNLPNNPEATAVHSRIADFETARAILIFGNDLSDEQPILYLRVRKAWSQFNVPVVVISDRATSADAFAEAVVRYAPGEEVEILTSLSGMVRGGGGSEDLKRASEILRGGFLLAASSSVFNSASGEATAVALRDLCASAGTPDGYNLFALGANEQGARDLGILPTEGGKDTKSILEACASGEVKSLWLLHCDPFSLYHDRGLVERALENVEFLVVQDILATEATLFASAVLPSCSHAEYEGTYTNIERRVQRVPRILPPKGSARPPWQVFCDLRLAATGAMPFFGPSEVMEAIAKEHSQFAGVSYSGLAGEGCVLAPADSALASAGIEGGGG